MLPTASNEPADRKEQNDLPQQTRICFGFGSNLSFANLKWKGLDYIAFARGILHGHKLDFSVSWESMMNPAYASTHPSKHDSVHGCLLILDDPNWSKLRSIERPYAVKQVEVELYSEDDIHGSYTRDDRKYVQASTFVYSVERMKELQKLKDEGKWLMAVLPYDENRKPGKNYLHTIIHGATELKLDEKYIAWLRSLPCVEYPEHHNFEFDEKSEWNQALNARVWSMQEVEESVETTDKDENAPYCVMKGIVFSMKYATEFWKKQHGGIDVTLIMARRWAYSNEDNTSCIEKLEAGQKEFLNALVYSHIVSSPNRRYTCVGTLAETEKYGFKNYDW